MANLSQMKVMESLNGALLVDKPVGLSFSTVVKAVKRNFGLVKVGHGGSLDAAASGLLVLLIGDSNKFAADVMAADRSYSGTMRLGLVTDTHDVYGRPLRSETSVAVADDALQAALPEFKGDVFQTEPRFCSVRKEGTAGYEIADTGEHSQFLAHVYRMTLGTRAEDGVELPFELVASKGVLVRSLVHDFGEAVGCGAALSSLRRTGVGAFRVDSAVAFDRLLTLTPAEFADLVEPVASLRGCSR